MDLHCLARCVHCDFRAVPFGHGTFLVAAFAAVDHASGTEGQKPRSINLCGHYGDLVCDELVTRYLLAVLVAFLRISDRLFQRAPCQGDSPHGHVNARPFKHHKRLLQAAADLAYRVCNRHTHVIKKDLCRGLCVQTHFFDVAGFIAMLFAIH